MGTGPGFLQGDMPVTQAGPAVVAGKSSMPGNPSEGSLQLTLSALASPEPLRALLKSELAKLWGSPHEKKFYLQKIGCR